MSKISIVIPTLNEGRNIGKTLRGVRRVLKGYDYEILVVDGHSTDSTVERAMALGARVVYDSSGKGSALVKGMHEASGRLIISMDADLSNKPEELLLLIAGIKAGYDICMGSRFLVGGGTEDMPAIRKLGNKFFVTCVNLIYGSRYTDLCYGYRSFSRKAVRELKLRERGFGIETEIGILAQKKHMKVLEVPSYEKKRVAGEGKLRTIRDGWRILDTIIKNMN